MAMLETTLDGMRILVIEDVLLVAMEVEGFLRGLGARVSIAPTLDTALQEAARDGWDAAVVDLNLHGQLSLPVIRALTAKGVPVILTTGYSEEIPGLDDSLPRLEKPYSLYLLERAIGEATTRIAPIGDAADD